VKDLGDSSSQAGAAEPALLGRRRSAPPGGSEVHEVTSVGARILLVKLSSLGDVVHTLPVVNDIRTALPDAQIDWVVEKSFAPLLARAKGLNRVIGCELRRWSKAPLAAATRAGWRAFRAELQQQPYDAVIDLQGLTKSALVARLARLAPGGKRFALANQTEGSGYEAPTRWVADVAVRIEPHIHALRRSRELAARALGYDFSGAPDFGLAEAVPQRAPKTVAFVHGTSRADKQWPLSNWIELGRHLDAAGYDIALAHGTAAELETSREIARTLDSLKENNGDTASGRALVWPLLPLDQLTAELASCAGVIGVDSGVSHIAVALGMPHVQIYNFDTAWRTGPDSSSGRQLSVFAAPAPGTDAVWQAWLHCVAAT
jgi:heptosyltransferase-1